MTELDQALFLWLNLSPSAPDWVLRLAQMASQQWLPYLVVATITALLIGREPWRGRALRTLLAVAIAAAASRLLKYGFTMPRPAALGLGVQWLPHSPDPGFPSSHATVAAAWAVMAAMVPVRPWWRVLFVALALVVGWSRIALGLHFPFDVMAGWILGTIIALVVQFIANAIANQGAVVDPVVPQDDKASEVIEP